MDKDEVTNLIEKKKAFKIFLYGMLTCAIIALGIFSYIIYIDNKQDAINAEQLRKYEIEHKQAYNDSIAIVKKQLTEFTRQKIEYIGYVARMNRFDSARATMRYVVGDIVYIKPDSIKGVVSEIVADSTLTSYKYFIVVSNKGNDPNIYERKDKLLY